MPEATRSPRAISASTYGVDPDYAETLIRELPEDFRKQIAGATTEARSMAWLMLDLVERYNGLRARLTDFYWRDAERADEPGHLLNAIEIESGLADVADVITGLASIMTEVAGGPPSGSAEKQVAAAVRRHAADHYREVGRPAIVLDAETGRVDLVGNIVQVTPKD